LGNTLVGGFTDQHKAVWSFNNCAVILREGDQLDLNEDAADPLHRAARDTPPTVARPTCCPAPTSNADDADAPAGCRLVTVH
jgi:hypothetical protein